MDIRSLTIRVSGIFLVSCMVASSLLGATRLIFPRFSFESETLTGLAIANLSPSSAAVTLTAYGTDGLVISRPGLQNPVQLDIPANQQIAKLTIELFGGQLPTGTVGWVELTSPGDGLTGFFLFLNSQLTQLDGADLPEAAPEIVFNIIRVGDGYSTELNLINPQSEQAEVSLSLIQPDLEPIERPITLVPRGILRIDPATFFGVASVDKGTYLRATSQGGGIAGFEFVRSETGDLLGLNAKSAQEALDSMIFPQMVALGPWSSELGVLNYTDSPTLVTVTAHQPDGSLYGSTDLQANPVTRGLGGRESAVWDLRELFGFTGGSPLDGWLEVKSTEPSLNGYVSYGIPSVGSLAAIASVRQPSKVSVASHIATSAGFFTGLAMLNQTSLRANTRVVALTPQGEILGSYDSVLQPGQRTSKLISEIISATENRSDGFVWVKSDLPIYISSLFGAARVLANVPPQPAPSTYRPDANLPELKVSPPLAIVQPGRAQNFTTQGAPGPVAWSVNGILGGSNTIGTINTSGRYTAPDNRPEPSLITVSAESGSLRGGAGVDIIRVEELLSGLGVLQSIVYLRSLKQLYEVELLSPAAQGQTRSPASSPQADNQSELFQVTPPAVRTSVRVFGDNIVKMIPYTASNGTEHILMLGRDTGNLIRFDAASRQTRIVYTGLNQPSAMAFSADTGNVLIAEADRVTEVAKSFLESGIVSSSGLDSGPDRSDRSTLAPTSGVTGIDVDRCTGEIYLSVADQGTILAYNRTTGETRTLVSGLSSPGHLLVLYRRDVPCPDKSQLLVAERGADRIALVAPSLGAVVSWVSAPGVRDLVYLPSDNPYNLKASIAYGIFFDLTGRISIVDVTDQYEDPPDVEESPQCSGEVRFDDPNLEAGVRAALGLNAEEAITCELAASLTELSVPFREIARLNGIRFLENLEVLDVSNNRIRSLAPVGALRKLQSLNASFNLIESPGLSANLDELTALDLSHNLISDLSTLVGLEISAAAAGGGGPIQRQGVLPALEDLNLSFNRIVLAGPLSRLTRLKKLDLSENILSDLSPLLQNPGFGVGDLILLSGNPIDRRGCSIIIELRERGVEVAIDVACAVDLVLAATVQPSVVRVGDLLLYSARIRNSGTEAATNVYLLFDFPVTAAFRSVRADRADCVQEGSHVRCDWGILRPGGFASASIRVDSQSDFGPLVARATVGADQFETNIDNNEVVLETPLASADLMVTKTASESTVILGENLVYSIEIENKGPDYATAVEVEDRLPSGFAFETANAMGGTCSYQELGSRVSCRVGSIAPDSVATITIEGTLFAAPGSVHNQASARALEEDPNPSDNQATATVQVVAPNLVITKADSADPVTTLSPLAYTINISNIGSATATNLIITDNLPAGVNFSSFVFPGGDCTPLNLQVVCTYPSLDPSGSVVLTINTLVVAASGTLTNTVSVAADQQDSDPSDNLATETTAIAISDLAVTKSAGVDPVVTGTNLDYTIQVTNLGPDAATGVVLTDTLPPAVSFQSASLGACAEAGGIVQCPIGSLAPAQVVNVTLTVRVDSLASTIVNVAAAAGDQTDPDPDNSVDSVTSNVVQRTDLAITKVGVPALIRQGDDPTFLITVTNNGPSTATGVLVRDPIPADFFFVGASAAPAGTGSCILDTGFNEVQCTFPSIPSGQVRTVTVVTDFGEGSGDLLIDNTATVSGNETDPNAANNTSTFTFQQAQADLSISITDNPDPVTVPNPLDYTITVQNAGPDSATGTGMSVFFTPSTPSDLTIDSAVPSQGTCTTFVFQTFTYLSCDVGTINPGGNAQILVQVTPRFQGGTLTADASVGSSEVDGNQANNGAQAQTTVQFIIP